MLAQQTDIQIPPIVQIKCHIAVWYWARRLAEAQGLVMGGVLDPKALLEKICGMEGGPQEAMKALPKSGQWALKMAPPVDTVLFWADKPTHSAVVTGAGQVTGYNQAYLYGQSPVGGLTTIDPSQIFPQFKLCFTIAQMTILKAAAAGRFGVYPR